MYVGRDDIFISSFSVWKNWKWLGLLEGEEKSRFNAILQVGPGFGLSNETHMAPWMGCAVPLSSVWSYIGCGKMHIWRDSCQANSLTPSRYCAYVLGR